MSGCAWMGTCEPVVTAHAAPLRVALAGQVDHGKSTLVARLLMSTGDLPPAQVERLEAYSRGRGVDLEISYLLDALRLERDQAVTVDATLAILRLPEREVRLVDVPGHAEFLRNMITGAATAEAALLVVDAVEGVQAQTLRHLRLLHLLGVSALTVAVNKMDRVGYDAAAFHRVRERVREALDALGDGALGRGPAVVPVSASTGEGVAAPSARMPWHEGPALTEALVALAPSRTPDTSLRLPVQDVYRHGETRVIVGRVESGSVRAGALLRFQPGGQTSRVARLVGWPDETPAEATAGQSVGIVLEDDVVVARGDLACPPHEAPPLTRRAAALAFWLGPEPLCTGTALRVKSGTRIVPATVTGVTSATDLSTLAAVPAAILQPGDIGHIVLSTSEPLPVDFDRPTSPAGRAVLMNGFDTAGGALWTASTPSSNATEANDGALASSVPERLRTRRVGHSGAVIWLTGLPGAGKSTLATAAETRLFEQGYLPFVLDGDTLRTGISADLGFSPGDRAEQVRRVAHMSALLAQAGTICLVALVSPYRADRQRARTIAGCGFREIFVSTSVEICRARDPKGMYKRAVAGEIPNFTGVSDPYETPDAPDLIIDSGSLLLDDAVTQLVSYIARAFPLLTPPRR